MLRGRERVGDRAIGVVLGILLGIAIVAAFVFLGSGETIDAPSLDQNEDRQQTQTTPTQTAPLTPTNPGP